MKLIVSICLFVFLIRTSIILSQNILPVELNSITTGVAQTAINLNGTWKFGLTSPANFWENSVDPGSWPDIRVPGECALQGFTIAHNIEYPYKKQIDIPSDFRDKKILLRFDGVYSYARVWVNGHFVCDHHGGFTTWYCDITKYVIPGSKVLITVGVTDCDDDISYGSGYAHHLIGGMLRGVSIVALPKSHLDKFYIETDFDKDFMNSTLKVILSMSFDKASRAMVNLTLKAPNGQIVSVNLSHVELTTKKSATLLEIPVKSPVKWDAEHPNLYSLEAEVMVNGNPVQKITRKIGFRKVEIIGNKMFVNGKEVKLHGTCRHDVHPLYGRSTTDELDLTDVLLCKEANINFVRTSHYPPSEKFLEMCDKYGIYVEEEAAVCFISTYRGPGYKSKGESQNDTAYATRYLGQFSEMVERDRSHPSVIIWSLGNESYYGLNFRKEYDYVKNTDKTRPVVFSYPRTAPKDKPCFDIFSYHYPDQTGTTSGNNEQPSCRNFGNDTLPVIHDEFGHLPCYNLSTLKFDPNIRNFWGESVKMFWDKMFEGQGCLGGSLWAMADDIFMLPQSCVGYGQWGFVDGWRRKKPEFWHVKKAFTPIKIEDVVLSPGNSNAVVVYNRFDHTNLNELKVLCKNCNITEQLTVPDIAPHTKGSLQLPFKNLIIGDTINLRFYIDSLLVDEYNLPVGKPQFFFHSNKKSGIKLSEDGESFSVASNDFTIKINITSGKIVSGIFKNEELILGGPYLYLGHCNPADSIESPTISDYHLVKENDWEMTSISARNSPDSVFIYVSGMYDTLKMNYILKISSDGLITTVYHVDTNIDKSNALGLYFDLSGKFDLLTWKRRGLWTVYPKDHIGRISGIAYKNPAFEELYRVKPEHNWTYDSKDFYLYSVQGLNPQFGSATNDFRSTKEHILYYSLYTKGNSSRLLIEGDNTDLSARSEVLNNGNIRLYINNQWWYPDLIWGNYCGTFNPVNDKTYIIKLRFVDDNGYQLSY